ncbi:MAG: hypothetical protein WCF94_04435 [bacterium]
MNHLIVASGIYLVVTLIILTIRSAIEHHDYGWIAGGSNFWSFLWPRLKLWLVGVCGIVVLIMICANAAEISAIGRKLLVPGPIGLISIAIIFTATILGLPCLAMPFCAVATDNP